MNILKSLAAAALLSVSLSGMAFSQTMDDVMSGMGGEGFADALEALDTTNSVSILVVSDLEGATEGEAAFNEVMTERAQDIDSLRIRVSQSNAAMTALEGQGYSADQVVAISSSGDDAVTLYVLASADGAAGMTTEPAVNSDGSTPTAVGTTAVEGNVNTGNANAGANVGEENLDPDEVTDNDGQPGNDAELDDTVETGESDTNTK